jgi:hypothetical protein
MKSWTILGSLYLILVFVTVHHIHKLTKIAKKFQGIIVVGKDKEGKEILASRHTVSAGFDESRFQEFVDPIEFTVKTFKEITIIDIIALVIGAIMAFLTALGWIGE